ncbi:MAG: aldo/keto reductase [Balneolaceae bacterium]|nr:aldo/keto reductase [Balneolaceae bacterium]
MNYRSFKDASVAEIGLGTWQLGSSEWGEVSEEEAFSILQSYIDNGGNFIDTADIYGMGVSERKIGKFLKQIDTDDDIYVRYQSSVAAKVMATGGRKISPMK